MSGRADQGSGPQGPGRPSLLVGAGHLAALWGLAFVAPLFDLLGENPDFFVARGNDSADIVVFALVFALLPPLVMLAAEALAGLLSGALRWAIHLGLVGLLLAAIALAVIDRIIGAPGGILIAFALALGAAGAAAYARTRFLRAVADVLIPAPAVLLAFFLFFSDVSDLVLPENEAEAASIRIPSRPPVVEVIFDELPLGTLLDERRQINARRYPAFAELARSSTWYRGATTVAGFTPRAVPAILTGRLPGPEDLPTSSDHPRSIFTLLGATYQMNVLESSTSVCPSDICGGSDSSDSSRGSLFADLRVVSGHLLLPDGLASELPAVDQTFGDFAQEANDTPRLRNARAPDRVAIALGQRTGEESIRLSEFARDLEGGPTLNLIHVEKPHYPWTHFPDGRKYSNLSSEFSDLFADGTRWDASRSFTDLALQRHMLETGFTDLLLGDLIKELKRTGLWDRALVVVVSDHGNAVIPQAPRRNPTPTNLGQIAPVPMFIKTPGQSRGKVVDEPTCTTDVLPLTAVELGIDYPWPRHPCSVTTVTVANSPEGESSLPAPRVERLRSAYVARIDDLFGADGGWDPVLRFTPNPELVGRPLSSVDVLPPTDLVSATLEEEERLEDVDAGSEVLLAALLRGQIEGGAAGQALAASVNGRIAAVGTTFDAAGEVRYSLLVPPALLADGANRVTIHRVLDYGITPKLLPLGP